MLFGVVEQVENEGKDLSNLLWELIKYTKDILVWKTSGKLEIYNENEIEQIKEIAEKVLKERLLQIIYTLSSLENEMKWSSQKTILFEVAMIKMCHPEETTKSDSGLEDIYARLNEIENKIKTGNIVAQPANTMQKEKIR